MNKNQLDPDGPTATGIRVIFSEMAESQAAQQDAIGFGEEGHRLRAAVEASERFFDKNPSAREYPEHEEHAINAAARDNLRNYYMTKLGLITTEVAEAMEEVRNGHEVWESYYSGGLNEDLFPIIDPLQSTDKDGAPRKPEGVPSELADIVIRIWSLCGEANIDLGPIIIEKLNYNATRAQRHGGKAI